MSKISWSIIRYVVSVDYVFGLLKIFFSFCSHFYPCNSTHPSNIIPILLFSLFFSFFHQHPYSFLYFEVPLSILYLPSSTFTYLLSPYMLSLCLYFFFSILPPFVTFFSFLSFLTYNFPFLFLSPLLIILLISSYFHHLLSIYWTMILHSFQALYNPSLSWITSTPYLVSLSKE